MLRALCVLTLILLSECCCILPAEAIPSQVPANMPLIVSYGQEPPISDGQELSKAQAARAPTVSFGGTAGTFYTLIMVDPDAPSPDSPTMAQWIHWIVANIPGDNVSKGDTITPYAGPTPPRGSHRYIFMLYEQPDGIKVPTTQIAQRAKFNVAKWAQNQGLPATPTAAVHFTTRAGS